MISAERRKKISILLIPKEVVDVQTGCMMSTSHAVTQTCALTHILFRYLGGTGNTEIVECTASVDRAAPAGLSAFMMWQRSEVTGQMSDVIIIYTQMHKKTYHYYIGQVC